MESMKYFTLGMLLLSLVGCSTEFLSEKPDKSYVIPKTVADFQALLNNSDRFNLSTPALGEVGTDDYWIPETYWLSTSSATYRNGYIWAKDIYEGYVFTNDWNSQYHTVNYANLAVEGLGRLTHLTDDLEWQKTMGSALFYRAMAFYHLSQLFCPPFLGNEDKLGIPLPLEVDLEKTSTRSTVLETYSQMLEDVDRAIELLPQMVSIQSQPSRATALALKARLALLMHDVPSAYAAASSSYSLLGVPMDFNIVNAGLSAPFSPFNEEVAFYSDMLGYGILRNTTTYIDSNLFASYHELDSRKAVFFEKSGLFFNFKGSLSGSVRSFSGISKGEVLLMLMEAEARLNKIDDCLAHLRIFLSKRYDAKYTLPKFADKGALLGFVLSERRKELLMRGLRWPDLRRLNAEVMHARTIKRKLGTKEYSLAPNSNNYVLPIPDAVINHTGMQQNTRD